jgi:LacI family transcriptional regulator
MVTIKDVSRLSGFSVATVSRVINRSGYVNSETEKAIRSAMEALNYLPSEMARSLAGKQSLTIALMVPDILNPFFPELARAIEDEAHKQGYTVILCNSDNNPEKEANYFRILESKRIDGIIITSSTLHHQQLLDLQKKHIPFVVIGYHQPGDAIMSFRSKYRQGARMATDHLFEQGCRTVAHICGPIDSYSARERALGYEDICRIKGRFEPSLIGQGDYRLHSGYKAMLTLLEHRPDIDGVFAANDLMAVGAMKALHQLGRTIPGDVKVAGFDGINLALMIPQLTTVVQPISEMGRLALNNLMKMIQKQPVEYKATEMDVTLSIGKTTTN